MSIAIKCTHCGKGLKVPDDRVGKLAKCPACGQTFTVLPPGQAGLGSMVSKPVEKKFAEHRKVALAVPSGLMVWFGLAAIAIVCVGAIIFGPLRIWHQWEATEPHAQSVVEDVIIRGLQSYVSHQAWFDPKKSNFSSGVRQVAFTFMPYYLMMPEKVQFDGVSTQGLFTGFYHPRTGEVECTAEVGARTIEVLTKDLSPPTGKIQITGREPNGQLSVEVDGKDATVVMPNSP